MNNGALPNLMQTHQHLAPTKLIPNHQVQLQLTLHVEPVLAATQASRHPQQAWGDISPHDILPRRYPPALMQPASHNCTPTCVPPP